MATVKEKLFAAPALQVELGICLMTNPTPKAKALSPFHKTGNPVSGLVEVLPLCNDQGKVKKADIAFNSQKCVANLYQSLFNAPEMITFLNSIKDQKGIVDDARYGKLAQFHPSFFRVWIRLLKNDDIMHMCPIKTRSFLEYYLGKDKKPHCTPETQNSYLKSTRTAIKGIGSQIVAIQAANNQEVEAAS